MIREEQGLGASDQPFEQARNALVWQTLNFAVPDPHCMFEMGGSWPISRWFDR
jgi:hypothetical protein